MGTRRAFDAALQALAAAVLVTACATTTTPPPTPEVRSGLGSIAVVADPSPPAGNFETFARGKLEGTAKGAAGGAAYGFVEGLAASGGRGGPYAAAATAIAVALFTLVGATVGAVTGHEAAVNAETADRVDLEIAAALGSMDLADGVASAIRAHAALDPALAAHGFLGVDAGSEAPSGIDTILNIRVLEAGFAGGSGDNPKIAFYMSTRIEALDARTNEGRYRKDFLYASAPQRVDAWFDDSAKLFVSAFGEATRALADRVLDELLLVTAFPFPSGKWAAGGPEFSTCWFYPVNPPRKLRPLWDFLRHPGSLDVVRDLIEYPVVKSLQPELEWEALPRPRDLTPENEDVLGRLGNVTYDLRIWETVDGFPVRLVYDVTGLEEPRHRPRYTLEPATRYFWTFRARYTLDGQPQVTRWAFSLAPAMTTGNTCDLDAIPPPNYYRFVTPSRH